MNGYSHLGKDITLEIITSVNDVVKLDGLTKDQNDLLHIDLFMFKRYICLIKIIFRKN